MAIKQYGASTEEKSGVVPHHNTSDGRSALNPGETVCTGTMAPGAVFLLHLMCGSKQQGFVVHRLNHLQVTQPLALETTKAA